MNVSAAQPTPRNSRGGGGVAQRLGRKPETERGGVTPCFLFRNSDNLPKKTNLNQKCISTVATLHFVDLKILQTVYYFWPSLCEPNVVLTDPRLQQHDWSKQI